MSGVKKEESEMKMSYGFTGDKGVERIIRYIVLTDKECRKKGMTGNEIEAFRSFLPRYPFTAILLSYHFGCARGYRASQRKVGNNGKQIGRIKTVP